MSIQEIIELYKRDEFPTNVDDLGRMQAKVDDYAKSSLELAHAAEDPDDKQVHLNQHVEYISVSGYLDYKIRKALNMEGGALL